MNDECDPSKPGPTCAAPHNTAMTLWPWDASTYGTVYLRGECSRGGVWYWGIDRSDPRRRGQVAQ